MSANTQAPVVNRCAPVEPVRSRERLVCGCSAAGVVLLSLWMSLGLRHYTLDHNFHHDIDSPVLALELASNAQELHSVLDPPAAPAGKKEQSRSALRTNTYEDCLFIVLYSLFLWSFGRLVSRGDTALRTGRRTLTAVVIATAIADYVENFGIFRALGAQQLTDSLAHQICWPSRCKWLLFGSALLITAYLLLRSQEIVYSLATRRLLAIAYAVAGVLIITGLSYGPFVQLGVEVFGLIVFINLIGLLGPYVSGWIPPTVPESVENFCEKRKARAVDVAVRVKQTPGS